VSNWAFVAIAYAIAWGGIATYALVLARRVAQARTVSRRLEEAARQEQDPDLACDAPPAP